MIKLIVGIGNPGIEYVATRHNAGFWFIDQLAKKIGVKLHDDRRFHGAYAQACLSGEEIHLLKPDTFMNRSGLSVIALAEFFGILPKSILIVHDELSFLPGITKLKLGGSSGGHNGLKNIAAHLLTWQYWRLRIGIGHPRDLMPESERVKSKFDVVNFVLKNPRSEEKNLIDIAIDKSLDLIPLIVRGEFEVAIIKLRGCIAHRKSEYQTERLY
ncbi:aminoacyl-tRNA hydrolase [Candidatus Vallotia lariciata]|uniref:aminoacyl-tRNA hydrolase n=1 Tax=Candidatus Vallotia laricis TaxID=2018052 RepID=UPI001D0157A5|nr:aminoacyl-tRNA hydrolase [Candidatus Vallotia lariciata]UDG83313.1 Peptidyl-tRNA hydrolase [Candidatus Vallotia lariciata]